MDDISQKLAEILNDEESMNKVRSLAQGLLSNENEETKENPLGVNSAELNAIMGIMNRLKTAGNDNRTALLLALKPNLSKDKQQRVDTAVKLLKLIEILPYLKESGILNIL